MRRRAFIAAAAATVRGGDRPLFSEDPAASYPVRERNIRQVELYAAALPPRPRPSGETLHERCGYPPPRLLRRPELKLTEMGEDSHAVWSRCQTTIADGLEAVGIVGIPKGPSGRRPLLIAQHGAGSFPELVLAKPGGHHDLLREPAKRGWIVYAPLAAMHYPFDNVRNPVHGAEVRAVLDGQLRPKGTSLAAVDAARVSGALTALLRRGLASQAAMAGLSFGSVFTLYMMVLDKRIAAGVASCSFRDFFMDGIDPRDPRGRPFDFTAAELARWIAPRPLQVQAGRNDPNLPVERARAAAEKARAYWRGSGGFEFAEFEGGHEFSGPDAWRFLTAQLAQFGSG